MKKLIIVLATLGTIATAQAAPPMTKQQKLDGCRAVAELTDSIFMNAQMGMPYSEAKQLFKEGTRGMAIVNEAFAYPMYGRDVYDREVARKQVKEKFFYDCLYVWK